MGEGGFDSLSVAQTIASAPRTLAEIETFLTAKYKRVVFELELALVYPLWEMNQFYTRKTHLASNIKAIIPAANGAAEEVPLN